MIAAQRLLLDALKASYGCPNLPIAAHGIHMAAQRLHLGALGAAYGCSEAPNGCPWGSIWLLRGSIWLTMGLHMAVQRLHLAAEVLRVVAHGGVCGSHAADMQYYGPGWAARILRICPDGVARAVWGS